MGPEGHKFPQQTTAISTPEESDALIRPYYVTASPPSAVSAAFRARFTGPTDTNLVVCKCTLIEIYRLGTKGLELMRTEMLFGRVALLLPFRPANSAVDLLYAVTECRQTAILGWESVEGVLYSLNSGGLLKNAETSMQWREQRLLSPYCGFVCTNGEIAAVNMFRGELACVVYHNSIPQIPENSTNQTPPKSLSIINLLQNSSSSSSFNNNTSTLQQGCTFSIILQEINIISFVALPCHRNTFAVIFRDSMNEIRLRSYTIHPLSATLSAGAIPETIINETSSHLIPLPVPYDGVLVLSSCNATIVRSSGATKALQFDRYLDIKCWSFIDGDATRILIGERLGFYHILFIHFVNGEIASIQLKYLGKSFSCSSVAYLDFGFVYIGSMFGDSALIRILEKPDGMGENIATVRVFQSLGPIVDFLLLEPATNQCGNRMVTCSGAFNEGSLRSVQYGVDLCKLVTIDLQGIEDAFCASSPIQDFKTSLVALSTPMETYFMRPRNSDGDLEQFEVQGLISNEQTIIFTILLKKEEVSSSIKSTLKSNIYIHVVPSCARLCELENSLIESTEGSENEKNRNNYTILSNWTPNIPIVGATILLGNWLYVVTHNLESKITALEVTEVRGFVPILSRSFKNQISCISSSCMHPEYITVGFWDDSVQIIHAETLRTLFITKTTSTIENVSPLLVTGEEIPISSSLLESNKQNSENYSTSGVTSIRSVMICNWQEKSDYLLCGRSDGVLLVFYLNYDLKLLEFHSATQVGFLPLRLQQLVFKDSVIIFAACDSPVSISMTKTKDLILTPFHSRNILGVSVYGHRVPQHQKDTFTEHLVIAVTNNSASISSVDLVRRMHTRSESLKGESGRAICHLPRARQIAVLTERSDEASLGNVLEAYVRVFSEEDLHQIRHFETFRAPESPLCIISFPFDALRRKLQKKVNQGVSLKRQRELQSCNFDYYNDNPADKLYNPNNEKEIDEESDQDVDVVNNNDQFSSLQSIGLKESSSSLDENKINLFERFNYNLTNNFEDDDEDDEIIIPGSNLRKRIKISNSIEITGLREFIAIGTVFSQKNEQEPEYGRILVYDYTIQKGFQLVSFCESGGPVYSLAMLSSKIIAAVGSVVKVYSLVSSKIESSSSTSSDKITLLCVSAIRCNVLALQITTIEPETIFVADVMMSVSILLYKTQENGRKCLKLYAKDMYASWPTCFIELSKNRVLLANEECNIQVLSVEENQQKNLKEITKVEKIQAISQFHLGEMINRIRYGSLFNTQELDTSSKLKTVLSKKGVSVVIKPVYVTGSQSGHVGVFGNVTNERNYKILLALQRLLGSKWGQQILLQERSSGDIKKIEKKLENKSTIGVCSAFSSSKFRVFKGDRRSGVESLGNLKKEISVIDGDLVKAYNFLSTEKRDSLASEVSRVIKDTIKTNELDRLINELQQLH